MKRTLALLFAKAPKPGASKARLHSAVPPQRAAQIHAACIADTLRLAQALPGRDVVIFAAGGAGYFRRVLQKQNSARRRAGQVSPGP